MNSSGNPVNAKIFITGHDTDSSHVYSSQSTGFYARPIEPGTWQVTYSASGYISQTQMIEIADWETSIVKDIQLLVPCDVTFAVTSQSVPMVGASVNFNGIVKTTDANGTVIFNDITEGNGYNYSISQIGYFQANGTVGVFADKTFAVELVPETATVYSVVFDVKHLSVPVDNATVLFNGVEQQTSSTGTVTFTNILQGIGLDYSVSKSGFRTESGLIDVSGDEGVSVELIPLFDVVFSVSHLGVPIEGVTVSFNGSDQLTTLAGTLTFGDVLYGLEYSYTVSKLGYVSVTGAIDVISAKNIDIELAPLFTVLFDVSFNSLVQETATDGTTSFIDVLYGTGYNYAVSLTDYHSVTGQVDVTENKSISIEMDPVSVQLPDGANSIISVWPNPFSDEIHVRIYLNKPSFVNLSIYSMDGKLVSAIASGFYYEGGKVFNCLEKSLNSGGYIIRLQVGEKTYSQIIQHIR